MKKLVSLILFFLSVGVFFLYSFYTKNSSFDYNLAQFLGYVFFWSTTLLLISLFAFVLNIKKYKSWVLASLLYIVIALLIASAIGNGSSGIISLDGKDLTWFFMGVYLIISIIYLSIQFLKNKRSS